MWSYATSATRSGRSGTHDRSFLPVQRLGAPGSLADACAASSAQAAHGWSDTSSIRSGFSSSTSSARRFIVNAADTPTCWRAPCASYRPSSSEPTTGPLLCSRYPATTTSAVRSCLILNMARSSCRYRRSSGLATTPSRPAPSYCSNQPFATSTSVVSQAPRAPGA